MLKGDLFVKWITYRIGESEEIGWVCRAANTTYVIPVRLAVAWLETEKLPCPEPVHTMMELLQSGEEAQSRWKEVARLIQDQPFVVRQLGLPFTGIKLCTPIPQPVSIRDFYAFEEHVINCRTGRGLSIPEEWYEIPTFYFSNPRAVFGPGEGIKRPRQSTKMDYELELACVIGKKGRDIPIQEAEDYIFGYMIMNDWSARDFQQKEMKVGLGPSKGKDFATSFGPFLVTSDELLPYRSEEGRMDLEMKAFVNGKELSRGNFRTIYYTFAEMIAYASRDVTLYPGDVIGSGTVGSGCILEKGEENNAWLKEGDRITLSVTGLGVLHNYVI